MKPPYCKLCEHEHWGLEHVFGKVSRRKPSVDVANGVANEPKVSAEALRVEEWRRANREKYNARQREAARRHREKVRAARRAVARAGFAGGQ